ncbi:putative bifunctional diguanylate cyclase/phosphodiesterase [Vibrio agarilyticus]|nr:bifunctional diguanylate cyclase/phosphodiesterase [Vibrio agarilyticus]
MTASKDTMTLSAITPIVFQCAPTKTLRCLAITLHDAHQQPDGVLISIFEPITHSSTLIEYHHLCARLIERECQTARLSHQFRALTQQFKHDATHDPLTNLHNRANLSATLEALVNQHRAFSLCLLDIDDFKQINAAHGHMWGDKVIRYTAKTLKEHLPATSRAFRIGADEFAFIIFNDEATIVANNLINLFNLGYSNPVRQIAFTVSIGIASYQTFSHSKDELMQNATLALKACKQSQKQQFYRFDETLRAEHERQIILTEALRYELERPIDESDIYVVIQPIVALDNPQWQYFEVLARWSHSEMGALSPFEFITVAEQSGLIIALGKRIIELACLAKQTLENQLGYTICLSINCSAIELTDASRYIEHLTAMMIRYHHRPRDFVIELTESVLLNHNDRGEHILDALRYLGFRVALDDFGTGYSSLNYIHSYPIDIIKIDATFVRNMLTSETAERVISFIAQLAHQLRLNLVAEGVENVNALAKLRSMGCQHIQGYYFSKPLVADEMIALIRKNNAERQAQTTIRPS